MKRYEQLQDEEKLKEFVKEICQQTECGVCHFADRCYQGHTGVLDYLMEELEDG